MINKYNISKDEKLYRAFPDLILVDNKLICVFVEMDMVDKIFNICITTSSDRGLTWSDRKVVRSKIDDKIVALMRENSGFGIDALKIISEDNGETWSEIYNMPIPACHRPVITKLLEDYYLITYRFDQGKFFCKGHHGQNIMGCLIKQEDMVETDRDKIESRIFPIDYDRNINSNCGYTGAVQYDDGMIYVVSYIVDDNKVGQIRGYRFYLKDILIN